MCQVTKQGWQVEELYKSENELWRANSATTSSTTTNSATANSAVSATTSSTAGSSTSTTNSATANSSTSPTQQRPHQSTNTMDEHDDGGVKEEVPDEIPAGENEPDGGDQGGVPQLNDPTGGSTEDHESLVNEVADTGAGDFPIFWAIFVIVSVLLAVACWLCLRDRPRQQVGNPWDGVSENNTDTPGTPSSTPVTPSTGRRLIKTPFSKLADELGIQHTAQPPQIETIAQNESCETYQEIVREFISDKDNLVWIVPVAVLEKLFCAYVLYKLYRTCRRKRTHTLKSRQTMLAS